MAQQDKDRVWERPTKPVKKSVEERAWARLGVDDPRAVEILEAKDSMSKPQIRKQYKALIKVLHPDMNGGDRSQEEQLGEVVWAWDQIKASKHFREKD